MSSGTRRTRAFGISLLTVLPLLASCASVIPDTGSRPVTTAPAPAPARLGAAPRPYQPRPSESGSVAARPIPATPRPALPATAVPADATTAATSGVIAGPDFASLGVTAEQATAALAAFRISCPSVQRRADASGLTQGADWTESCNAAKTWSDTDASTFFTRYFGTVQIGAGTAFVTGYYEPEIAGSRTKRAGYDIPIYRRPADLVDVDLGLFSDELKGKKIRGRVDGGNLVQYYDRAAIESGALDGRGLEIAYAADAAEFFFF